MMDRSAYDRLQKGLLAVDAELLDAVSLPLLDWGAGVIGIKLGEEGFYLRSGSKAGSLGEGWRHRQMLVPTFKVDVQGTTGAGDTAIAGFLAGISLGMTPEKTLSLANAVGAFCVEAVSSIAGIPDLAMVQARVERGWERGSTRIVPGSWHVGSDGVFLGPADRV